MITPIPQPGLAGGGCAPGNALGRLLQHWGQFAMRRRAVPLLLLAALVVGAALLSPRLAFDNTPESFFFEDDPTVRIYDRFRRQFANDEFTIASLDNPPGREIETLAVVRHLVGLFETVPHVSRVTAITNVRSVEGTADSIDVADYIAADRSPADARARLVRARTHPYYGDLFVARDGSRLGIMIETDPATDTADKLVLTTRIRALLQAPRVAERHAVAIGAPILDSDVRSIVSSETGLFGAGVMLLVALGFLLAFRSWLGLVLPMAVAIAAILVSFAAMVLIGAPVGMLTPILPAFLVSVGVGSSVYMISEYLQLRRAGEDAVAATLETLRVSGTPACLASLTTAAGLFAFSSSRIKPVQELGLTMGIGLLASLLITLLLFPVLAPLFGRVDAVPEDRIGTVWLARLLDGCFALVTGRPRTVVIGAVVLVAVAIAGLPQLRTDYFYLGTFKERTQIRRDYAVSNTKIPVSNAIEIVLRGDRPGYFEEPAALDALDRLGMWATANTTHPVKPYSLANVVKELHQAYVGTAGAYAIPGTRAADSQLLLLFESSGNDELTKLATPDYRTARLTLMVPALPYSAYADMVHALPGEADRLFRAAATGPVTVEVTGIVPLWMRIGGYLLQSQISSFLLAALAVTLVLVLVARSVTLGLAMSAVNMVAVLLVLGCLGWMHLVLDPFTILVGSIALGILDDDTIHFMQSVMDRHAEGMDDRAALRVTYQSVGRAMLIMTAVMVVSFSVYAFSSVASLAQFGLTSALTIVIGIVVEYLLAPAVLLLMMRRMPRVRPVGGGVYA